jgi:hypothetical protein
VPSLDSNAQVLDQLEAISDNPDDAINDDPNSDALSLLSLIDGDSADGVRTRPAGSW